MCFLRSNTGYNTINYSIEDLDMNRRTLSVATGIFLCIIPIVILWRNEQSRSLCPRLRCISIQNKHSFQQKEIYSDDKEAYRALYQSGDRFLRIEAKSIPILSATGELEASVSQMKSMFEKAPAPYPGDISDAIVCDPAYIPVFRESATANGKIMYFTGYLNNRMTFGSCSKDQAVYKGIMTLTYCAKQHLLLKTELIAATDDFETHEEELSNQMATFACAQ